VREHLFEPERRFTAAGELRSARLERGRAGYRPSCGRRATGRAFLWLLSCRDKKVTRPRGGTRNKAVGIAAGDPIYINSWIPAPAYTLPGQAPAGM